MTHFSLIRTIAFALLITLVACGKDNTIQLEKQYPGVEPAMWAYFEKFERAAAERGVEVDLVAAGMTGSIELIHAHGTVGLCNHRLDQPNHVIIDKRFWDKASNSAKEMIIFHELGHCYLKRGHTDEKNADGTCASIMRSGRGGCVDFYNHSNRESYLDELYTSSDSTN
ncbi:MAG: hypothetical protein AAGJ18_21135 [Bacteroidota bacterium]